jgi:phosphoglycolate phosphatase
MIRTVLFDLDGTLLDTAPDLADALNTVLRENQQPALPYEMIRGVVSHGGKALIELGFGPEENRTEENGPQFEALRQRLLTVYGENVSSKTRLFPGMDEVIEGLTERGINWGIVTNKPGWLTDPLLSDLGLDKAAACIISGDTLDERKPHPAPMLLACEMTGSTPAQCVYIGDAQRDIEAGKNAGMHTLIALFGYFMKDDRPAEWNADGLLKSPQDLLPWLDAMSIG